MGMTPAQYMALMKKAQAWQDKMWKQNIKDTQKYGSQFPATYGVGLPDSGVDATARYMQFQKNFRPTGIDRSDLSGVSNEINTGVQNQDMVNQGVAPDAMGIQDDQLSRMLGMQHRYGTKLSALLSPEANQFLELQRRLRGR